MSSQFVNSKFYYYISSDFYGPNVLLGAGYITNPPGTLYLSNSSLSSNNWQIFYQDPIFLIRNYDYGANYQLGITEDSPTFPRLQLASEEPTQQWNITLWDDGAFRLANMWLGRVQMLGVSNNTDSVPIPVMNTAQDGSHWTFAINTIAGPVTDDMLEAVSLQVAPSSTSTLSSLSTSASTAISSTLVETTPATTTITAGSVPSSSISNGAIAGITVVAVVTAAVVALGLLFFVWWRRRQQRHSIPAGQAALAQQHTSQLSTAMQEVYSRPSPPAHMVSDDRERIQSRVTEMP